jgi:uncharacterized RDD family membrane protein YckC
MSIETMNPADTHAYAHFTRRFQAALIDFMIFMLLMTGALIIAIAIKSDHVTRILGFAFVAIWLLYEPILVSTTGGTIGHYACNLRVVDDRGGNISFAKAIVRLLIKSVLGWYSFVAMAVTLRHQAAHDLVTKSTVQIRDLAKAQPRHFSARRSDAAPNMPSRTRRIVIIVIYLFGCFVLFTLALAVLSHTGLLSDKCFDNKICTSQEMMVQVAVWLCWFGLSMSVLIMGWRGRLLGGRPG